MATPLARNVRFVPGRLVKDPTNLAIAYPYGGTELGLTTAMIFKPGIQSRQHGAEEFGGAIVESTYVGEVATFCCALRGFDADALARVFPNVVTGAATGKTGVSASAGGANLPGYRMSGKAFKLLWVPDDTVENHGLLIYNAIPGVEETAELALSISEEFGIPVFFMASPDASKRLYQMAAFDDLAL
jgi:hypothetical protein